MKKFLVAIALMSAPSAFALVDMKNANYTNTWTDMEVPGPGYDMKIVRTYNSRSLFNGIFGFGWCSELETSMEVLPEGTIKVKECGDGVSVVYSARELSKADVDKTISQIVDKIKAEKKPGMNEAALKDLRGKLFDDDDRRAELARQYGIAVPVKEGTKFLANGKEVEHFVFQKTHYTRNMADGSAQRFSLDGKLIAQYNKNGNFLKFEYEKDLIREIVDDNARRLSFKYYPNKKIQKITGPGGLVSEYRFEKLDDLAQVKNAWRNVYGYEYDELHNLTKSTWPDKTFISIKYDKAKDWVQSFTDRDKCVENYTYELSPTDPRGHYWSTVKKTCGKEIIAENRYEFWYKVRNDGQYFLQRVLTSISGNTTDVIYHEIFGKPVSIRRNAERVTYEYYPDGQVKTKAAATSKMSFAYDPQSKKVGEVTINFLNEKGESVDKRVTQFRYDAKTNLIFASNSDGQKISMTYDNRGRIATITDQAKKIVKIEYEERFGKPWVVTRPGLGAIKVSYKANGEISTVESKEGATIAVQVASTFNNLLDIIAPATAELYM